jgi:diadenosine tetraphosphate (Ap4A) HIT family hydrolase
VLYRHGVTEASEPCIICDIVAGRAVASFVHADDTVVAFMDLQPVTPGHVLIVPRVHRSFLPDLEEELATAMFRVGHRIAKALRHSGLRVEGVNLFLADGEAAFQEVFHVHLHVFPRYPGDGFSVNADWRVRERSELDATAAIVGRALAAET